MKPIYEPIIQDANTSFKVESYNAESKCDTAGWHIHPEFEIVYVKNGAGVLKIGSKTYDYENGVLVFLAGNIPHSDFGNNEKKDSEEIVVQFSKEFVHDKLALFPEFTRVNNLIQKSRQVIIFEQSIKGELYNNFDDFKTLDNQGKLINFLSILDRLSKSDAYETLFDTINLSRFKKNEIWRLEEAFEYVNNNYHKNISIAKISLQLGFTTNSFCRFFKKMTKRTFIDFVNEFRVGKAVQFFNENNSTVSDVMYKSGFNDRSYFTRQFKRYQGVTPSNYLKLRYGQLAI
ncbi:AraC family transcriptional regulator [Flagellimonas pacifica]|uniref:AraC-type DNA-binding protein n=1 Tax=Flagellimonas pacifica TaxID=1247520 RepID=A0A285MXK1_9FLAO|nr:AraC family transcriptional regulator [Allomuricauda parva]SNZ01904.1 AraC-type DNA-binding protein [Allomuricauda parva]